MDKKGELTSAQIIGIILLIMGFVIILIFTLTILDLKTYSTDELCRLSILSRATSPKSTQELIPLKCTTKKICITGGSDCEDYKGEKNVADSIKVAPSGEQTKTKIEETVANEMYDCWKMVGEGKLDLFGGNPSHFLALDSLGMKESTCIICARIKAKDISPDTLNSVNLNDYLESAQVKDGTGDTYLEKFTNHQLRSYPKEFEDKFTDNAKEEADEIAIIFMQINTEKDELTAGLDTGLTSAAFVFGTGAYSIPKLSLIVPLAKLTALVGLGTGGVAAFQTWRSRNLAAGYCGELTSAKESRNGCSVITTFNYDHPEALAQYCGTIEGLM